DDRQDSLGPHHNFLLTPSEPALAVEETPALVRPNASSMPDQWVEAAMIPRIAEPPSLVSTPARMRPEIFPLWIYPSWI
ncbi:MAG TPA: hypothetical protein VGQ32_06800, partial [Thermoanaerobaculia bacterium]|nr:hypothetical protein [Thermoanaerobaculia bacterium]